MSVSPDGIGASPEVQLTMLETYLWIIAARFRTFCFPAGFLFDTRQGSDVYSVAAFYDLFPVSYPFFMG
jgi:hypothetical protein